MMATMTDDEKQKPRRFQHELEAISEELRSVGSFSNGTHTARTDGNVIEVRDSRGTLVAFSSTRADYDQSLAEFVSDYLVR